MLAVLAPTVNVAQATDATGSFGMLPRTLGDALVALDRDPVIRDALPADLYRAFVAAKTDEWERFCAAVTDWHRDMYLRAIP